MERVRLLASRTEARNCMSVCFAASMICLGNRSRPDAARVDRGGMPRPSPRFMPPPSSAELAEELSLAPVIDPACQCVLNQKALQESHAALPAGGE